MSKRLAAALSQTVVKQLLPHMAQANINPSLPFTPALRGRIFAWLNSFFGLQLEYVQALWGEQYLVITLAASGIII